MPVVKVWLQLAAAVAALFAAPALARPSEAELAASLEAEARGADMYAYDQAAWHASDALQADLAREKRSLDDLRAQGFRGYVVEPGGDGLLLATFYVSKGPSYLAAARYWAAGSEVNRGGLVKEGEDAALSPLALQLIAATGKAYDAASEAKYSLCSRSPPNTIVLPPRADGTISAYILTSTTTAGVYPAGGHFRFDFGADGKLISQRPFMKSCFPLDTRPRDGQTPEAVFLSHLLDRQPTEIHVFVSYNIPVRLFIGTMENNAVWEVSKGKVRFSEDLPKK